MKKILLILLLLRCYLCFSQDTAVGKQKFLGQHSIYLELFGNAGFLYSIGYDYTWRLNEKHKIAFNCGLQYMDLGGYAGEYLFSVTPQISYLYAYEKNHHIELGIGSSYLQYYDDHYNHNTKKTHFYRHVWSLPFRFGYRYQQDKGGVFFKIAYIPIITTHSEIYSVDLWKTRNLSWYFVPLWFGISIGYTFK